MFRNLLRRGLSLYSPAALRAGPNPPASGDFVPTNLYDTATHRTPKGKRIVPTLRYAAVNYGKTYAPNGKREVARRLRQLQKGRLS